MNNELEIVREALRHTEDRLNATNLIAASSETRVMQFAAFNAAIATVLGVNADSLPSPQLTILSSALLLAITFFSVSIVLPRKFHTVGHFWELWSGHLVDKDDLIDVLKSQAAENDERIKFNDAMLNRAAKRFRTVYFSQIAVACFFLGGQLGAMFPM